MKLYDLDVTLLAAGMPMSGETIESGKALGGSETCALQMARALSDLGHHVTLFCNTEREHRADKVNFFPVGWVQGQGSNGFPKGFFDYARSTPVDVLIVQRLPAFFAYEYKSKVNVLWQHDLATKQGPSNFHQFLWNIDKLLMPSQFMKSQYQSVHGGPDELYHVTRNGIDLRLIDSAMRGDIERDRFRITFTSRPERGLDLLLKQVLPRILRREPRTKLYISRYDDPVTLPLYQELAEVAKHYGDRVVNLGNLGKRDLYENYRKSRLVVYPSMFEEISMLTANEAGACGTVLVGPWKAALPETCGGAHALIKQDGSPGRSGDPVDKGFEPLTEDFMESFAETAVRLMHDDDEWGRLSQLGRRRAEEWTWGPVAEDWTRLFHERIAKRSSEPRRIVKHFLFNSDVVAAVKYVTQMPGGGVKADLTTQVNAYIGQYMPFMALPVTDELERKKAMAEFYEQRSGGDAASWQTAFWADQEPRLHSLLNLIGRHKDEIKTVLDFGCAHGGYARAISNAFPEIKVVGVDVSPSLVRAANDLKNAKLPDGRPACEHPENLTFLVADEDTDITAKLNSGLLGDTVLLTEKAETALKFDCVVSMEVLEHIPDSEEVVKKLERHCRPDGWMVFTVPTGHRERDELVIKGVPPVHVRSFDLHDLRDLFLGKKDFGVTSFSDYKELELDRTFAGWLMAFYRNDGRPLGQIDWERKFFLQGPRETVAVCAIAHNGEGTIHRCLKSVKSLADQIVVLDNGPSTDSTVEIALKYTHDVRAGTNPFWCRSHAAIHAWDQVMPGTCDMAGFETPRNESVENVWADWVIWLDCDEQILDAKNIHKYLRPSIYPGFAVNQHHISVEPPGTMKKDIPARIFRNRMGIRCYGVVHEHFEIGKNQGMGPYCAILGDFNIHHDGYLTEAIRRARFKRNILLLKCDRIKYPDRLLGIFLHDVRDMIHEARYAMEGNGGKVTDEVIRYCQVAASAYRKHFLDKGNMLSDEGLDYYTQALQILGIGMEVAFNLDVKKSGAQMNGNALRFRALDKEEARAIIGKRLDALAAPLEGRYVS